MPALRADIGQECQQLRRKKVRLGKNVEKESQISPQNGANETNETVIVSFQGAL
jgi:hypothetical protein